MSNYFLSHPFLGDLYIVNIYEEYNGPRIFSLENKTGASFISYWIGDTEDAENWYLIPCSKARIISFEKKQIDLLALLSQQEQNNFYKIEYPFDLEIPATVTHLLSSQISNIKLPKPGLYVDKIKSASLSLVNENIVATHEFIVSKSNKKSKKNVLLDHVSKVCEKFSNLALGYNNTNKITGTIQPLTARYGSFAIALHADELESFENIFLHITELMINQKDITDVLRKNDIDIRSFCDLLESINSSCVDFELKNLINYDKKIVIHKNNAYIYLKQLSRLSLQYISSIRVPQADSFDKIFKVIDLIWEAEAVTAEILKVEQRHVAYYKQAAVILGLLSSSGTLTALGEKIALCGDLDMKMKLVAHAFEASDCCWAWMNWSDVKKMSDLDASSSIRFLTESCPTLSETTIKRRAQTLTTWHQKLTPYYREFI
ncbi:hypothetical protein ABNY11_002499 [Enterobacter roggenkampii]